MGRRLMKELARAQQNPPPGIRNVRLIDGDLRRWKVDLEGMQGRALNHLQPGTGYEGYLIPIELDIPEDYPFKAPSVVRGPPLYHPGLCTGGGGHYCLCMLPVVDSWSPRVMMTDVLRDVRELFCAKELGDRCILNQDIWLQYKNDRPAFDAAVRAHAARFLERDRGGERRLCELVTAAMERNQLNRECARGNAQRVQRMLREQHATEETRVLAGEGEIHPLHLAAWEGHLPVVTLLLDFGASVDTTGPMGLTPLHIACIRGHIRIAEALVEGGAKIDTQASYPAGRARATTPLLFAAEQSDKGICALLLQRCTQESCCFHYERTMHLNQMVMAMAVALQEPGPRTLRRVTFSPESDDDEEVVSNAIAARLYHALKGCTTVTEIAFPCVDYIRAEIERLLERNAEVQHEAMQPLLAAPQLRVSECPMLAALQRRQLAGEFQWANEMMLDEDRMRVLDELIGEGGFSIIRKGLFNGEVVAVKQTLVPEDLDVGSQEYEEFQKNVLKECRVAMRLDHRNIARTFGLYVHDDVLCLVVEYMEMGSLEEWLKRQYTRRVQGRAQGCSEKVKATICLSVAQALEYLDRQRPPVLHKDVRTSNVLLRLGDAGELQVKLADFGLARNLTRNGVRDVYHYQGGRFTRFPYRWAAPEVCVAHHFVQKSDIWSFGVLVWEVFSHAVLPFGGRSNEQVQELMGQENNLVRLQRPANCPDEVWRLMEQCWAYWQENRPTAQEVVAILEQWLQSIA